MRIPRRRLTVVAYDVRDDARRTRLSRLLEDSGTRVQYSVFECDLHPEALSELKEQVKFIVSRSDRVAYYSLCPTCENHSEHFRSSANVWVGEVL